MIEYGAGVPRQEDTAAKMRYGSTGIKSLR
jgi:hypothetical protein